MPGNDPYKGHDSQIVAGVETEQGTTVTPDRHLGKLVEETSHPDPTVNWYEERLIGGDRELDGKSKGQVVYDGGDYPVLPVDGFPLALLFGNDSVDDTVTPEVHTITPKMDGKPPTTTVEATLFGRGGGSDFARVFGGVAGMSGEVQVDNDSRLQVSLETEALSVDPNGTPTTGISLPSEDPWLFSDISSDFSFAGTTFARLEDFSLSVDNGSDSKHYITSSVAPGDPFEILYGNLDYDLSATITVSDDSLYQELVGATAGGVSTNIAFTRSNGDTLTIDATGSNLEEVPHDTPRGDDEAVSVEASIIPESVEVTVEDSNGDGTAYV